MSYKAKSKGNYGNHKNPRFFHSGKKQGLADAISHEKIRLSEMIANGEVGDTPWHNGYVVGEIAGLTFAENRIPLDSEKDIQKTLANSDRMVPQFVNGDKYEYDWKEKIWKKAAKSKEQYEDHHLG